MFHLRRARSATCCSRRPSARMSVCTSAVTRYIYLLPACCLFMFGGTLLMLFLVVTARTCAHTASCIVHHHSARRALATPPSIGRTRRRTCGPSTRPRARHSSGGHGRSRYRITHSCGISTALLCRTLFLWLFKLCHVTYVDGDPCRGGVVRAPILVAPLSPSECQVWTTRRVQLHCVQLHV